jgi:hypothetical protein
MIMRLLNNEEGASEIFGYVIILGLTLTCLALLTLVATQAVLDSQQDSQMKGVSQAFTVADSRMSKARFSTSIFQETPFKLTDGTMFVNGTHDDSYMLIYGIDGDEIYNGTLGTIKCVTDSGEIAYQDGGVFVLYPDGGSTMLSPPDFDYNGVTLTLPIMRIDGNGSAAYSDSGVLLDAASEGGVVVKYPGDAGYNPIPSSKHINLTIKSDYYKAWESYINERTRATAVSNPAKKMVNISLSSGNGRYSGSIENGFSTKGMDTNYNTPIEIFTCDLTTKNSGNDPYLQFDTTPSGKSLAIYVGRSTGGINKIAAKVEIEYYDPDTHQRERFSGYLPFQRKSETQFFVDLLNTNTAPMYDPVDSAVPYGVLYYDTHSTSDSVTWGTDPDSFDGGYVEGLINSADVHEGDVKSSFDVIQHYMRLMALEYADGPEYDANNHNYETTSTYVLQFKAQEDIKYLYITEGTLKVSLNGRGA